MGCIAMVRCVLVLRRGLAVMVTPIRIVPEQYNPWNNSTNKSQAPEDGCINIRNILSIKQRNKKASDIKLVSLYSSAKMMHGPINIRVRIFYFFEWKLCNFECSIFLEAPCFCPRSHTLNPLVLLTEAEWMSKWILELHWQEETESSDRKLP